MPAELFVGLAVTSHNKSESTIAVFESFENQVVVHNKSSGSSNARPQLFPPSAGETGMKHFSNCMYSRLQKPHDFQTFRLYSIFARI